MCVVFLCTVFNIFILFEFVRTARGKKPQRPSLNKAQGPKRSSCDIHAATCFDQRRKVGTPVQLERGFPPSKGLLGVWRANASYIPPPFFLPLVIRLTARSPRTRVHAAEEITCDALLCSQRDVDSAPLTSTANDSRRIAGRGIAQREDPRSGRSPKYVAALVPPLPR